MSDLKITPENLWPNWLLYWTRMSSKDISDYVASTPKEKRLVLIVWGTIESHGPLMPVANDSHLAALAADEVARQLHEQHGVTPIIFDGFINVGSPSATWEFPGAIGYTASPIPTIQTIWEQTLRRMVREGFRKFFVVNGDGGNWLNHWPQLKWDSEVIRDLVKNDHVILWGSNWDQEGGEPYVHAGEWDHALIT